MAPLAIAFMIAFIASFLVLFVCTTASETRIRWKKNGVENRLDDQIGGWDDCKRYREDVLHAEVEVSSWGEERLRARAHRGELRLLPRRIVDINDRFACDRRAQDDVRAAAKQGDC